MKQIGLITFQNLPFSTKVKIISKIHGTERTGFVFGDMVAFEDGTYEEKRYYYNNLEWSYYVSNSKSKDLMWEKLKEYIEMHMEAIPNTKGETSTILKEYWLRLVLDHMYELENMDI